MRIMLKKSYILVCQEKKFYHQRFGKKILTQTKAPIPPQKSNGGPLRTERTLSSGTSPYRSYGMEAW